MVCSILDPLRIRYRLCVVLGYVETNQMVVVLLLIQPERETEGL